MSCAADLVAGPRSFPSAQQEYRLLAEQVPEPPRRVQAQRTSPGIERHRLLHLGADHVTELAEILDGAEGDIGRVPPSVRQVVGARHVSAQEELKADTPMSEIGKRHDRVPAE